ncbi:MAG TPA: Hsp20 family protein [Pseudonocardiaceae bacterium]|nr:Hsp20 family protein [Pseudonocardiaceae bacterium]
MVDERPLGTFTRQLFLGDNLDANKLSADYDRGLLMLTIPVSEESKPRRISLSGPGHRSTRTQPGRARRVDTRDMCVSGRGI